MRLGMCTDLQNAQAAKDAGFEFLELTVISWLIPEADEAAFAPLRKAMLASPLKLEALNMLFPAHLKVTGPAVNRIAIEKYLQTAMRRAEEVGATTVVFGSGGARRAPDGFPIEKAWAQLEETARAAAEIAQKHGVTIVMEPLPKVACNFFNRVEQGCPFVDRINHPNLKLLADLFHVNAESEPFANMTAAGPRLAHIHLGTPSIPETGEGTKFDFKGFLSAVSKAGYRGRVSVEDNPGLIGGLNSKQIVSYATLKAIHTFVTAAMPPH